MERGKKSKTLRQQFPTEWAALKNAIDRCNRRSHPQYKDYGGRGFFVDPRYTDPANGFANLIEDIGPKKSPSDTFDRIDNDRGYLQGNIRWEADWSAQMRNRRKPMVGCKDFGWGTSQYKNARYTQTYPLVPFGEKLITLKEAALRLDLKVSTLRQRFERGMPPHEALTPTLYCPNGTPRIN